MRMPDYQVTGDGRVTVFLLHGIYGSKEYWRHQTERLVARGYRGVAWDAPGYGLSPLPEPFSFDVVAEAEAVAGFRAISVPTLLVAGEVDQVGHPAGMKRVADMIRGAEFGVVSGSGHYPWAENPAEFNRLLLDFLGRHFPAK